MPLYEYECTDHGVFDEIRPFAKSSDPAPCPTCGAESARVISVPRFRSLDGNTRTAMERNEKSAHQPHVCTSGCSHGHSHKAPKTSQSQPAKLTNYTGPRPWVVEHA